MKKISIIVPVYMVEPYLCRCVDSILVQTFADFELILVDDGSPDNCGAICEEYARKDSRVHVIHQSNGGLSAARNTGIDWVFANSESQWITFVDSDDWIHPRMLEVLFENVQQYADVNISICRYMETNGVMGEYDCQDTCGEIWSPEDFFVEYNTNAVIACGKLYHRECFAEIRYPVGKIHEDEFTTYKILFAQKVVVVNKMPLYYYFQNESGITRSGWSPRRLVILEAQQQQMTYFQKNGFVRAHDSVAVWYAGKLCQQRRNIIVSALLEEEKKHYLMQIRLALKSAMRRYWRIYCRRSNRDIFCEIFPALGYLYRVFKNIQGG